VKIGGLGSPDNEERITLVSRSLATRYFATEHSV
jgi:hypothetical protein